MSNPVSRLSSSARRRKRLFYWILSPCFWLIGPLALAATWALLAQPHISSLLIGVPVLAFVFYQLVTEFREEWSGDYQRLAVKANINVQEEIEKSRYDIHLNFGAGHAILECIEVIDSFCLENDLRRLSSFLEESMTGAIYSTNDMLAVTQSLHSLLLSQVGKGRLMENRQLIVEDLADFNATLQSLGVFDSKVCLSFLSNNYWNQAILIGYRRDGYCI